MGTSDSRTNYKTVVDRIHELGPQSGLDATPIIELDKFLKRDEIALK